MWIIALSSGGAVWTIVSPVMITYLIVGVSGIPMLERKYEGRADFQKYRRETSAFFPWFPKK